MDQIQNSEQAALAKQRQFHAAQQVTKEPVAFWRRALSSRLTDFHRSTQTMELEEIQLETRRLEEQAELHSPLMPTTSLSPCPFSARARSLRST